jgi:hypothetical protein
VQYKFKLITIILLAGTLIVIGMVFLIPKGPYLPGIGYIHLKKTGKLFTAKVGNLTMTGLRIKTAYGAYYDLYAGSGDVANLKLAIKPLQTGFVMVRYTSDGKSLRQTEIKAHNVKLLLDVIGEPVQCGEAPSDAEKTDCSILTKSTPTVTYSGYGIAMKSSQVESIPIQRALTVHPIWGELKHPVGSRMVGLGLYVSDKIIAVTTTAAPVWISHISLTLKVGPSPAETPWEMAVKDIYTKFNPPQSDGSRDYTLLTSAASPICSLHGDLIYTSWEQLGNGVKLTTYGKIPINTTSGSFFPIYASFTDSSKPSKRVVEITGIIWIEAQSQKYGHPEEIFSIPVPVKLRYTADIQ